VVILVAQLKSVLGVHVSSSTTIGTLRELTRLLGQAHAPTVLVAVTGIAVLVMLPRMLPRLSAPLVWVVASIVASAALGLEAAGVSLVGGVPSGLPSLTLPDLSLAALLWPAAAGIALMSYTETVATARTFCRRDDAPINPNQELIAVAGANLASAFLQGMPAGGGASQTAVADQAGVRSQMAQWVRAAAVVLTVLFLSPLIALLPKPALGALILVVAVSMIKPDAFRAIARVRRDECAWAVVTLAGVVLLGTLEGILVAVVISVLTLFYQANHPPVYAVAYNCERRIFRRAGENEGDTTFPRFLMLRTEGRLTFANAANAAGKMKALIEQSQPQCIVLECSAIPDIEYTALEMLADAERNLRARAITLWLAAVNPDLMKVIERSPLGEALGPERVFPNLHEAAESWHRNAGGTKVQ
jgi:MFS superfamily sulfate permease-like transporter